MNAHEKPGDRPSTYEGRRRTIIEADDADDADAVSGLPDYGAMRWALGDDNAIKVPPI